MPHSNPLFADALIACISDNRAPTVYELTALATRIHHEVSWSGTPFEWLSKTSEHSDRLYAMRAAHLALFGDVPRDIHSGPDIAHPLQIQELIDASES